MSRRILTASSLQRYAVCPASAVLPRAESVNERAHRGHVIHAFLENVPKIGREEALAAVPEEYRDACAVIDVDALPLDALRFAQEVTFAYDVATGRAREIGRGLTREQAYADLKSTEIGGTADVVGLSADGRTVVVLDFKTGRTEIAAAERNWQLLFLAIASSRAYGAIDARVGLIHIPEDGLPWYDAATLDAFDVDAGAVDLRKLFDRVEASARAVEEGRPPSAVTGEHCRYCPCLAYCPAQTALVRQMAADPEVADLDRPVTVQDAARAYEKVKALKAALRRVEQNLYTFAAAHPIPLPNGMVLGPVESSREGVDGEIARRVLAELYGQATADRACEWSTSKAAIERALKPLAVTLEKKLAPLKREALAAIAEAGGISRTVTTSIKEHVPDKQAAIQVAEFAALPDGPLAR